MLCIITTIQSDEINVLLCNQAVQLRDFEITSPPECIQQVFETTETCKVNAFNTNVHSIKIATYLCQQMTQTYSTYVYFNGVHIKDIGEIMYSAVSAERCKSMITDKFDQENGELHQVETGVYKTGWEQDFPYRYCQEIKGTKTAVLLKKSYIQYDLIENTIQSPETDALACKYESGICITEQATLIWQPTNHDICTAIRDTNIAQNEDIVIHYDKRMNTISAEIPEIMMTFHSRAESPVQVKGCFDKGKLISTAQGIMLEIFNCTKKDTLQFLKENLQNVPMAESSSEDEGALLYVMNYVYDILSQQQKKKLENDQLTQCQNDQIHAFLIRQIAKQFPSDAITFLANEQISAISQDDIITQIPCTKKKARLLQSLKYEGKFAARPIAKMQKGNKTVIIQNFQANQWEIGVTNFESYQENSKHIFNVDSKHIVYKNYSLSKNAEPMKITPRSSKSKLEIKNLDFTRVDIITKKMRGVQQLAYQTSAINSLIAEQKKPQLIMGTKLHADIDIESTILNQLISIKGSFMTKTAIAITVLTVAWALCYPIIIAYLAYDTIMYKIQSGENGKRHRHQLDIDDPYFKEGVPNP